MKRAIALGILAVSMCLGVAACSDGSSGTTQGNTGQNEETKKKIPVPPPRQMECSTPDEGSCSEDCCNEDGSPNLSGGKGCKAWLGRDPVAKCKEGVSDRGINLFAPRE